MPDCLNSCDSCKTSSSSQPIVLVENFTPSLCKIRVREPHGQEWYYGEIVKTGDLFEIAWQDTITRTQWAELMPIFQIQKVLSNRKDFL
jgi:hypothetical protein